MLTKFGMTVLGWSMTLVTPTADLDLGDFLNAQNK